jgi:hypothetical protein
MPWCSRTYQQCGSAACWANNRYDCQGGQTLKRTFTKVDLNANNELDFQTDVGSKAGLETYAPILQLIAQVTDACANGENVWLSVGATKNRTSLCLTLHLPEGPTAVFAATLRDLANQARTLL